MPRKSEATKSKSRPELMICDLSETDAGNRQNVSVSAELDSKTSREERTGTSPEDDKPERRDRSRRTMRRSKATTKGLDLGQALLNAEPQPEPEAPVYQKEGPKIKKDSFGRCVSPSTSGAISEVLDEAAIAEPWQPAVGWKWPVASGAYLPEQEIRGSWSPEERARHH